jgi:hypothetical protein
MQSMGVEGAGIFHGMTMGVCKGLDTLPTVKTHSNTTTAGEPALSQEDRIAFANALGGTLQPVTPPHEK